MQSTDLMVYYIDWSEVGPRGKKKAVIRKMGMSEEGSSHPQIIQLITVQRSWKGFLKPDAIHNTLNDIEIIMYHYGRFFEVEMADVISVYVQKNPVERYGIISVSVADNASQRFISFKEMRDQLFNDLLDNKIKKSEWIESWMQIRERKKVGSIIWDVESTSLDDAICSVEFGEKIATLWCDRQKISLDETFCLQYLKMMMFDLLLGQADRTPSNYGLIIDWKSKTARLAPLFDNSMLSKPYIPDAHIAFNNLIINQREFLRAILKSYGNNVLIAAQDFLKKRYEIKDFSEKIERQTGYSTCQVYKRLHKGYLVLEELNTF